MKVTAIFDIGKTNKKFFLFDRQYREVCKEYIRFDEIEDEDGYPCDDLASIVTWVQETLSKALNNPEWEIEAVNFSTYGASFVHLDADGQPLTPLYNYLKPLPEDVRSSFYAKYGDPEKWALETASPTLGMLNSGLQLYWLKHSHPQVHEKIRWSLHFPQYLSYILTGIPVSDYTSVGCHTGLWDFKRQDYHPWVYAEGLDRQLAPLVSTDTCIGTRFNGQLLRVGVGIHDSSGALLPYVLADTKPFLLVSTGTWSISLNPFSTDPLTEQDLARDCLHFMRIDGSPTKAARLFLGREYSYQVKQLVEHFGVAKGAEKEVAFNEELFWQLQQSDERFFRFEHVTVPGGQLATSRLEAFTSFAEAYHQLMWELVALQVEACRLAMGSTNIKKLYIDGGFANNDLFVQMLARIFPDLKIRTTHSPLGSALGAAVVIGKGPVGKKFLKKHYGLKKIKAGDARVSQD